MTMTIRQLSEAVLASEKQQRALLAMGEFLRGVADIEQVELEARARCEAAQAAAAQAASQQLVAEDALVVAREAVAQERRKADLVIAEAQTVKQRILDEAEADAVAQQAAAQLALDAVHQSMRNAQAEAQQLSERLAVTRAEYDDLKAKLDALRSTAASIAGR